MIAKCKPAPSRAPAQTSTSHVRRRTANKAAEALLEQCQEAERLIHQQCMRIKRRAYPVYKFKVANPEEVAVARKLIGAGFRELAKILHPDAGGSVEAMTRLNRARERLEQGSGLRRERKR